MFNPYKNEIKDLIDNITHYLLINEIEKAKIALEALKTIVNK